MPLSETAKATPTLPFRRCAAASTCERDAALFGELHGIVDQVLQRGAQADGIADHERRQFFGNVDRRTAGPSPPRGRRANRRRCAPASAGRTNPAARASPGPLAARGIDEQRRKARQMFGAGLDGVDPAPLALVEIGGRQQIADRENAGQRRADLMREGGERGLDHAGAGGGGFAACARGLPRRWIRAFSPAASLPAVWCAVSATLPP